MKLNKIFSAINLKLLSSSQATETQVLGGISLKTVKGTVRLKPDQDDAWFFYLSGKHKRIFDIGANIGLTALMTNIQRSAEKLLLVDPNPEALSIAAKNLILNNLTANASFYAAFVGDKSGEQIPFYTVGAGAAGSMFKGHAETAAALNTYYLVPTVTIDNLVNIFGWKPDLVKIDVEGAESLVLRGSAQLAKEQQTIFMVEMHSPPELPMIENAGRVLDWCRQHKYKAWYMRDAVHLRLAEQIADRGKCHLLLMSEGKEYPPELAAIKQRDPLPSSEL